MVISPEVKLDAAAVEVLWVAIRDLVQPSQASTTSQFSPVGHIFDEVQAYRRFYRCGSSGGRRRCTRPQQG